jgi:hypothetical protein
LLVPQHLTDGLDRAGPAACCGIIGVFWQYREFDRGNRVPCYQLFYESCPRRWLRPLIQACLTHDAMAIPPSPSISDALLRLEAEDGRHGGLCPSLTGTWRRGRFNLYGGDGIPHLDGVGMARRRKCRRCVALFCYALCFQVLAMRRPCPMRALSLPAPKLQSIS